MAQVVEQKAGNAKVRVSLLTFITFWSCVFLYFISLIVTSKTFQTWNSIDQGLIQISFCCISISNEHLQKRGIKKLDQAWFRFMLKKIWQIVWKGGGQDGRVVSIKHKVVGSTPQRWAGPQLVPLCAFPQLAEQGNLLRKCAVICRQLTAELRLRTKN